MSAAKSITWSLWGCFSACSKDGVPWGRVLSRGNHDASPAKDRSLAVRAASGHPASGYPASGGRQPPDKTPGSANRFEPSGAEVIMKSILRTALVTALLCVLTGPAVLSPALAKEPVQQFLEKLRERELFDAAEWYLESLKTNPHIDAETKQLLPYEHAQIIVE